jgi:hypothetical protein
MLRKTLCSLIVSVPLRLFLPVTFLRHLLFLFLLSGISLNTFAQDDEKPTTRRGSRVIDDTTKQIYGPNTSKYYYEQDVFLNRQIYYPIDTLIRNFHRFDYVQRFQNLYQDLGVIGTAIRPILYQTPAGIGRRSGAHVYDLYWDTEPVLYYDTKSPYTNMRVILGGGGRSITRATFSRNINPRWNFGFTYRGVLIDKQIQKSGKGDRVVRGNYYDAYTAFQSKDSTYRLFANFRRNFHRVEEFGGVRINEGETFEIADFANINVQPWLTNAESNDLRMNVHLFHQYEVGKALQVYHIADRYRQKNNYIDLRTTDTEDFYDFTEIERDSVRDVSKFKTFRNEIGIKGNLAKLFYNGYYAIRHYSMYNSQFNPDHLDNHLTFDSLRVNLVGNENYLGGRIALMLDSIVEVSGGIEAMSDANSDSVSTSTTNYRIYGEIKSKWFEARLTQMEYSPGFMEQAYRGAFDSWNNNFANTGTTHFNGYLHYRSRVFNLSPGLTFTRLKNYIFYKKDVDNEQQVLPMQSSGSQIIASPEVKLSLTFFRHITLSGQAIYTRLLENADSAITAPELLVNAQLSYSNIFFNGNLDMHGGVDFHWKSAYNAMGYDPAIRQFYIQNEFTSPAFPVVDIFFGAKIKRGRVFFKYHNLIQAITKSGYLPTPYYPGQKNIIEFGFDWSFYD